MTLTSFSACPEWPPSQVQQRFSGMTGRKSNGFFSVEKSGSFSDFRRITPCLFSLIIRRRFYAAVTKGYPQKLWLHWLQRLRQALGRQKTVMYQRFSAESRSGASGYEKDTARLHRLQGRPVSHRMAARRSIRCPLRIRLSRLPFSISRNPSRFARPKKGRGFFAGVQ